MSDVRKISTYQSDKNALRERIVHLLHNDESINKHNKNYHKTVNLVLILCVVNVLLVAWHLYVIRFL